MTRIKAKKIFVLFGIVAPLLIFLFVTIFSFSIQGYNFIDGYVSFLGSSASPFRHIVNVFGFGLFGVMIIGLGYFFFESFNNYYGKIASRIFMGVGVLLVLLAFFPTDPNWVASTFEGRTHSMIGNLAFVMWPVSIFTFGLAFKKEKEWGNFWAVSSFILAGIALLASGVLKFMPVFDGLVERLGIGADLLWMFLVSVNLFLQEQEAKLKTFISNINLNLNA
jgi:hypothetical protein